MARRSARAVNDSRFSNRLLRKILCPADCILACKTAKMGQIGSTKDLRTNAHAPRKSFIDYEIVSFLKEIGGLLAERQGFEPWIPFRVYTLSKRAPSTTRPSLRLWANLLNLTQMGASALVAGSARLETLESGSTGSRCGKKGSVEGENLDRSWLRALVCG